MDTVDDLGNPIPDDSWKPVQGSIPGLWNAVTGAGRSLWDNIGEPKDAGPADDGTQTAGKLSKKRREAGPTMDVGENPSGSFWSNPNVKSAMDALFPPAPEKDEKSPTAPYDVPTPQAAGVPGRLWAGSPLGQGYSGGRADPTITYPGGSYGGGRTDDTGKPVASVPFKGNKGDKEELDPVAVGGGARANWDKDTPPQRAAEPAVHEESLLGKMLQWRDSNKQTLAALGAGFMNRGMQTNAFSQVPQAVARDVYRGDQNQTANALMKMGASRDTAIAMAHDPHMMAGLLPIITGTNKNWQIHDVKDAFGGAHPILFEANTGETMRLNLRGGGAPGAPGVPGVGGGKTPYSTQANPTPDARPHARPTLDDFDPAQIDHTAQGWDYLKQYPEEVEATARAYMDGRKMPTGNPRQAGINTMAQAAAQKVAMDLGRPDLADDTLYTERRKMRMGLGNTANWSAIGGQITAGGTAMEHLAQYGEALADQGNWNGLGLAPLGHVANDLREVGTTQAGKVAKSQGEAQHYGQEVTKLYGGGPGAETERSRFLNASAGSKTSTEYAQVLRAERDMIPSRLKQLHANIEQVLGKDEADKALKRVNTQENTERLNKAIARLDPTGPEAQALKGSTPTAAPAAAPVGAPAPGKYAYDPATKTMKRVE